MEKSKTAVRTTLRIPGRWAHFSDLLAALPAGFRLGGDELVMPDGSRIEFGTMPADDEFPRVFRSACRLPACEAEWEIIDNYTVNVLLSGPGGSQSAARVLMQAGAAIVQAGGAGVFIDNSALAHGARHWLEMAADGGPDALSFAFAGIVQNSQGVWTVGMCVLGLPDLLIRQATRAELVDTLADVIRYLCDSERSIEAGHVVADQYGPRYQAVAATSQFQAGSPLHNPFGRLQLVSIKDLTECN